MDENRNVANELREALKKAFDDANTASNLTEMVVLPTKQVIALVEENDHLREENEQIIRKSELDKLKGSSEWKLPRQAINEALTDGAVIAALKEMAIKAPDVYAYRNLKKAIWLILRLQDENKQYVQEVNDLHELNTSMVREIIKFIKLNGMLSYGGYVIHDSTIDQICKKYGVEVDE